jgi:hypothetical protein
MGNFHGTWGRFHITLFSIVRGCPAKSRYLHRIRLVTGDHDNCFSLICSLVHETYSACAFVQKVPFQFFIALDLGPHPPGMNIWKICLLAMFLLGIFIGVLLYVVGLRLFQCHPFFIIDSRWLTN